MMRSGGWLMLPIMACSIVAAAICIERAWVLRRGKVAPPHLFAQLQRLLQAGGLDAARLRELSAGSPLAKVFAAGIDQAQGGREQMKEAMMEAVAQVGHDLERHLTSLGVIASVAPLLGLLGTVIGMIRVFTALMLGGAGNAEALAGGISEALVTTAAGLAAAIPALVFHRFFLRRVDELVLALERQAARLADAIQAGAPAPRGVVPGSAA